MTAEERYKKLEHIITSKMFELEQVNAQLKQDLALAKAKLEVYERIANVSNRETSVGFGPPIVRDDN